MSKIFELSKTGISALQQVFAADEHFINIALPRIRLVNAVREVLGAEHLEWKVKYSPVNRSENCITVSLVDPRKKFHFYYAIPLSLRLSVHLYLGDNTFNFFEAHPLLIKQGVIAENEYPVEATVNTLPHLVLSSGGERYEHVLLNRDEYSSEELKSTGMYRILSTAFEKFNGALFAVIDGTCQL
ncbi:hypothetical protein [Carboxylicivirga taeanensis]|uniref:hypothetical protein n=1 Tax=Carboxylicivirga taeanensis TaxID=1416875 RepID=UPI003F6E04DA